MRLLHTADWHLGQLFYQYERTEEHERFLGWLLDTLSSERADALLVAGDVFDHANPSAASQKQLYRFLTEARRRDPHLAIVLIAGNHDSPGRLEAPSPLLQTLDIVVVGQVIRRSDGSVDAARLSVPLRDRSGRIAAWCLAVPFLRSGDLPAETAAPAVAGLIEADPRGEPPVTPPDDAACSVTSVPDVNRSSYASGVARLYQQALQEALSRRSGDEAIIALGHCHVAGGAVSADSERPILAGGLDALAPNVFDPRLAYVALGHFHRAQVVAGDERLRYSGSPLPLSFTEIDYPHQVVCVDLDGDRVADIRPIPVPRFVDLLRLPAEPAGPDEVLAVLDALNLPDGEQPLRPYLEVRVRLERPEPGLRARVDAALASKPVRLARIETTHARVGADLQATAVSSVDELVRLGPDDIFRRLYRARFGEGQDVPQELIAAFGELLRAVTSGEEQS